MDLDRYALGNPVSGFMQGYAFADNIFRKDREEKRADEKFGIEKQLLNLKLEDAQNAQQLRRWQGLSAKMRTMPDTWMEMLTPEEDQLLKSQITTMPEYSYLASPEKRMEKKQAIYQMYQSMPNQQRPTFDMQTLLPAMNTLFGDQLNKGSDDTGQPALKKEITGFYPTPNSKQDGSFFAELTVTRQDGSQYKAPLTLGRTANPNDQVRPLTIPEVADYITGMRGLINYADSRMISLGDEGALKRIEAQQRGTALGNLIPGGLETPGGVPTPSDQRRSVLKSALRLGSSVNEAIALSEHAAPSNKESMAEVEQGVKTFREMLPVLDRSNPEKWTDFVRLARQRGVPAELIGQDLSRLSPKEYAAALDQLETYAAGIEKRIQWNTPKLENVQYDDRNIPTHVYPGGRMEPIPGAGGPKFRPSQQQGITPEKAIEQIQHIDKELYSLGQKGNNEALMQDPKIQEAMAKNPMLKTILSSGDDTAKEQYRNTLLERRRQLAPLVKQDASEQRRGDTGGIERALAGRPAGRYRDRTGNVIKWDGAKVIP